MIATATIATAPIATAPISATPGRSNPDASAAKPSRQQVRGKAEGSGDPESAILFVGSLATTLASGEEDAVWIRCVTRRLATIEGVWQVWWVDRVDTSGRIRSHASTAIEQRVSEHGREPHLETLVCGAAVEAAWRQDAGPSLAAGQLRCRLGDVSLIIIPLSDNPLRCNDVLIVAGHSGHRITPPVSWQTISRLITDQLTGRERLHRRWSDRSLSGRCRRWASAVRRRRSIAVAIVMIAVTVVALVPAAGRIDARGVVTASERQYVAAPVQTSVLAVDVVPGDLVTAGQRLATLDSRELDAKRSAVVADLQIAESSLRLAQNGRDASAVAVAKLEIERLRNRRRYWDQLADRLVVLSPIDGLIIDGDWTSRIGTPLRRGETLMEIAAEGNQRIEIRIDPIDADRVRPGLPVHIDAPGIKPIRSRIDRISPVIRSVHQQNRLIAVADLPASQSTAGLRIGSSVRVTIDGPPVPWIWNHLRRPAEWLIHKFR